MPNPRVQVTFSEEDFRDVERAARHFAVSLSSAVNILIRDGLTQFRCKAGMAQPTRQPEGERL